jgi:hypothetical protein
MPQTPQLDPNMAEYLKGLNSNPNERYIQLQHPVTKQTMVVPNPNFNPEEKDQQESGGLGGDNNGEEDFTDKSWCSIVRNYCPESTECVWWVVPEGTEEEEDGGCSKVSQILASIEAEHAKADFFKKAEKALEALLTASNGSALASLMDKAITSFQLKNEQTFMEGGSDKKANKKEPVVKKEVIAIKEEQRTDEIIDELDENADDLNDDDLDDNLINEEVIEILDSENLEENNED